MMLELDSEIQVLRNWTEKFTENVRVIALVRAMVETKWKRQSNKVEMVQL